MKFHLRNILEKLHAESRTEVAARAVREGLVRPTDGPAARARRAGARPRRRGVDRAVRPAATYPVG